MRRLVRFGANLKLGLPQLYICFGELRTLTPFALYVRAILRVSALNYAQRTKSP